MSYKEAWVECGDFRWKGRAKDINDAVIGALARKLPRNPSLLLRARVGGHKAKGGGWYYIAFESALKMAGYTLTKTKEGFGLVAGTVTLAPKGR